MAQFNGINDFVLQLINGEHSLNSDQLACYLTNSTGSEPINITDLTPCVGHANILDKNISTVQTVQDAGVASVEVADKTMVADGAVGPFQYIFIYNVVNGKLLCYYDFLTPQNLVDTQNFIVDFTDANNYLLSVSSP